MGRFRSLMRRVRKPFVMAVIAASLALSLTVTTTQKAEANPLLLPPLLMASGVMPVGTALGLVSLTGPIGWGILGVAALAVGLAATQDYWLPYVTGEYGDSKAGDGPTPPGSWTGQGYIETGFLLGEISIKNADQYTLPLQINKTGSGSFSVHYAWRVQCKHPTTNAISEISGVGNMGGGTPINMTIPVTLGCINSQGTNVGKPLGAKAGVAGFENLPPLPDANTPKGGPGNIVSFGTLKMAGDAGFDPNGSAVMYQTTVECVRADGTFFSLTAESAGDQGGIKMPSCAAAEPGAHGTGKTDVIGTAPGQTPTPVWNNPRIPASGEYPLCAPERPGPMCSLTVTVDGKPCVDAVGSWNCANWREIANQDAGSTTPRVQCSYGPYAGLAVDVCNPMERAYESPGGVLGTEANLDGNPSTRNDATPQGEPYQKPETGNGGMSGNLLVDAFVPKQDVVARSEAVKAKANLKIPLAWMNPQITGPGGSGCPNWVISVPGFSQNVICESSFTAAIVGARGPLFGLVAGVMVWPLIRSLWYASIPVLRVTPSSSK